MSDNEKGNENNINNEEKVVPPVGNNSDTSGSESDKTYKAEFVDKLKGEKDNLRKRVEELEAEKKANEEKALKEKEDWKTLYEKTKAANDELNGKLTSVEQMKLNGKKESELKSELGKLGVKPQYIEKAAQLAKLDSIKIDSETGVIYGADVVAKSLSEDWPDLFGQQTATVTQGAPKSPTPSGALSLEEWKKLPYDERKKREGDVMMSSGVSVKR